MLKAAAKIASLCGVYSNVGKRPSHNGQFTAPAKQALGFLCECTGKAPRGSEETSRHAFCQGMKRPVTSQRLCMRIVKSAFVCREGRLRGI